VSRIDEKLGREENEPEGPKGRSYIERLGVPMQTSWDRAFAQAKRGDGWLSSGGGTNRGNGGQGTSVLSTPLSAAPCPISDRPLGVEAVNTSSAERDWH